MISGGVVEITSIYAQILASRKTVQHTINSRVHKIITKCETKKLKLNSHFNNETTNNFRDYSVAYAVEFHSFNTIDN